MLVQLNVARAIIISSTFHFECINLAWKGEKKCMYSDCFYSKILVMATLDSVLFQVYITVWSSSVAINKLASSWLCTTALFAQLVLTFLPELSAVDDTVMTRLPQSM